MTLQQPTTTTISLQKAPAPGNRTTLSCQSRCQFLTPLLCCFLESPPRVRPSNFGPAAAVCFFTHFVTFSQVHYSLLERKVSPRWRRIRDGGRMRGATAAPHQARGDRFLLLWHRTADLDLLFGVRPPVVNSERAFIPTNKREKTTTCRAIPSSSSLSVHPCSERDGGERED